MGDYHSATLRVRVLRRTLAQSASAGKPLLAKTFYDFKKVVAVFLGLLDRFCRPNVKLAAIDADFGNG